MAIGSAFVLGLLVGSFLNVCIRRWPLGQSVTFPGSHCPDCGCPIKWRDKIPVLSFFLLSRRCRRCKEPISWRYPSVELLNAVVYALLATREGSSLEFWKNAIFASMMLILIFTDVDHRILPDQVTLTGIATGIAFSPFAGMPEGPVKVFLLLNGLKAPAWIVSLGESLLAAGAFAGLLWVIGEAYYRLRGLEGLGFGDVKLIALIAAFQGSAVGALILVAGTCSAAIGGFIFIKLTKKGWQHPIPLGSYFACASMAALFAAEPILDLYWELVFA